MKPRIEHVYAVVMQDELGDEGIVTVMGGMPLIAVDWKGKIDIVEAAQAMANVSKKSMKVVRFDKREVVILIEPELDEVKGES